MERQNLAVEALADQLLEKLAQAIGELNLEVTTRKVKTKDESGETTTEVREVTESIIDRAGLKQLTSVLKELQSIKGEYPALEMREKEAKIESLCRGAGFDTDREDTGVILLAARMEQDAEAKNTA